METKVIVMVEKEKRIEGLIEALEIFANYTEDDDSYMVSCEHEAMYVHVSPHEVDEKEIEILEKLGFVPAEDVDSFRTFVHA